MEQHKIQKVLVANRGEIAIRVFRACTDLGLRTVAMYSKEDVYSLFRTKADEAYQIGEQLSPLGAYLDIDLIIDLAKKRGVDAIHPGYGFLSENANFAKACEDNGLIFIGPPSRVLAKMGDKLAAKATAVSCGVPIIPGGREGLKDGQEALARAREYGFPVILKAAAGGGGRGMRHCYTEEDVLTNFELVKSEAKKAFGDDTIFMEKYLEHPKHIEVQILADKHGNVVHLHERDCSLQRRFQKVVEYTPAFSVDKAVRERLCADAVKIAKAVGFENAGTVEFLVEGDKHYFIEMNPRIQVEHTVTEMVTGIDLVRAQILIAEGRPLSDPEIGITCQDDVKVRGYAIQCRVTTEDPLNNFAPDTGKITAYRTSGGFGIRLDAGNAFNGAEISPYYDSLLVKITCHDNTFDATCRKALRALSETRIRGVKTNISFITNILTNPVFRAGQCYTKFIDETPELFEITPSQNRANKMLEYIGNIVVNDPTAGKKLYETPRFPKVPEGDPQPGLKQYLDANGPEALSKWVMDQKKVLITDTTCRDGHQSLLATRIRTRDMVKGADAMAKILRDCFSMETRLGLQSRFGETWGWSLDDYFRIDAEMPDGHMVIYNLTQDYFLRMSVTRYLRQAIDWENGTCDFNNPQFVQTLEACRDMRPTPEDPENMIFGMNLMGDGVLVTEMAMIDGVTALASESRHVGQPICIIGWPTTDGSCGSDFGVSYPIGVMKNGAHPELCWHFLKYWLLHPNTDPHRGIPNARPLMEKLIDEARHIDPNQEWSDWYDGLRSPMTEAEIAQFQELLRRMEHTTLYDETAFEIVSTEIAQFLAGQRSAEETAGIIQSRMSIYVSEQSK